MCTGTCHISPSYLSSILHNKEYYAIRWVECCFDNGPS